MAHRIPTPTDQAHPAITKLTRDLHRGHRQQPVCRASGSPRPLPRRRGRHRPRAGLGLPPQGCSRWSARHRRQGSSPPRGWLAISAGPPSRRQRCRPVVCDRARPGRRPGAEASTRARRRALVLGRASCATGGPGQLLSGASPRLRTAAGDDGTGTTKTGPLRQARTARRCESWAKAVAIACDSMGARTPSRSRRSPSLKATRAARAPASYGQAAQVGG